MSNATAQGPLLGHRFLVTLGTPQLGRKGQPALQFLRVDLPLLHAQPPAAATPPLLVLHRAADADTRLHDWWASGAAGQHPVPRRVTVEVLDPAGLPTGLGWNFLQCQPWSLACGSLDARQPEVVVEQLALRFEACTRVTPALRRRAASPPAAAAHPPESQTKQA